MSTRRLEVFVSSTIKECANERKVARAAIASLNHEPVLFEELGSLPYPPRAVYKKRLEESDVLVVIYREDYGWIAPTMEISGIEDEFEIGRAKGMPILAYISKAAEKRDPRLTALIKKLEPIVTLFHYSKPEELRDRIRDDVTGVIHDNFIGPGPLRSESVGVPPEKRAAALAGLLLASDWSRFSMNDFVQLAEGFCQRLPGAHFKPQQDGSAYWTVRLDLSLDVLCTITQLDDTPRVAAAAMVLALLLFALAPTIRDRVLGGERLPRTEMEVIVTSEEEFNRNIDPGLSGLTGGLKEPFAVSESTDITRVGQEPIVVILRRDFGSRWRPRHENISDVHFLLARLIEVMTEHLLARQVGRDVLRPKLVSLARQISVTQ